MATVRKSFRREIPKCPTGIVGLDQITEGGLPRCRPTLICGSAGCGKTVLAMEFLVRGVTEFNEPGVFMSFEESDKEVTANVASMGFDLNALCARKKLFLDYVRVERSEIEETGEYDLEGLFGRLEGAIRSVRAKRVVLDTIEALISGFGNTGILRAELRRLFTWLKDHGVTALITSEAGDGKLTRYGIEEYIADCVILLDHRVEDQNSIRRLRVVKYRGTEHGTSEYPFLIGRNGFSVLPLSSLRLECHASSQRVSSGIPRLDSMLGEKGFFRGSSILLSGGAGTGKSSVAAHFAQAACQRAEKAFYIASEESVSEVVRNMHSIGIELDPWIRRGQLKFHAARPGSFGLERHLINVHEEVLAFHPDVVVIDPVSNFESVGSFAQVASMLTRLIDLFKSRQITAMFTSLTAADAAPETTEIGVSSLIDCWLLLRNMECNGERNRGLYILKSRGMAHSNQIREFMLTSRGVKLLDAYIGPSGVLTGTARVAQENRERAEAAERKERLQQKSAELRHKRRDLEAQIAKLESEFDADERQLKIDMRQMQSRETQIGMDRAEMGRYRFADAAASPDNGHA